MLKTTPVTRWITVLLVVFCSGLFAVQIQVKEDALDLLPEGIVASDLQLIQQLGMVNRVYLSIGLDTEGTRISDNDWQQLRQSVLNVGTLLEKLPLLSTVVYRLPPDFESSLFTELWPLLPVIADSDDYRSIEDAVSKEGIRQRLKRDFQLLNSPAGIGFKNRVRQDPLGLSLLIYEKLKQLRGEFAISPQDGVFASVDQKNCLIWADSALPLTDSANAVQVQKAIDEILDNSLQPGVSARLIGTLPHTLANIKTVNRDLRLLLPLATITLVLFIISAFRSFKGILVVTIPFLAALPAIMLQNLICGKVSALALGFGIVLTGLAVDFAVHIYLALTREREEMGTILQKLKRPILLAWCTTTGVFVVLLLSSVPSHRQMAVLAIAGITLAVLISWLLVPTIVKKGPQYSSPVPNEKIRTVHLLNPLVPIILWLLLIAGGMACWSSLQYNGDMRVLDAVNKQVQQDDISFHNTWRGSIDQALVLGTGSSLDEALTSNDTIFTLLSKQSGLQFQSVAPVLPGPTVRKERQERWRAFWKENSKDVAIRLNLEGQKLGFIDGSFTPFFDFLKKSHHIDPAAILHGPLYPLLASMVRVAKNAEGNDTYLTLTLVPENDTTWPILKILRNMNDSISIVSLRSWREQAEELLRQDIVRLSVLAGLLVIVLVTFFFRNLRMVVATLAPVCSALAGMSLFAFLSDQELNTMHVLMGIMVIGLCVDYGVFSACAHSQGITRTTRKAVSICAVSSCIGFGVLAFANHPALYSLGVTVLVGISVAWPTALWVTPAILTVGRKQ